MVPDDEVEALATRNVVRAVTPRAEMYDARAHSMMVRVLVAPVVRRADHPAEHQTTPLEVPPQADVERHVAVVGVDVQVTVLVGAVLDDEGVRRIEARRRVAPVVCRKKFPRERQQHEPLQRHDERLEPYIINDDAVCVEETYSKRRRVDGVAGRPRPPAAPRPARASRLRHRVSTIVHAVGPRRRQLRAIEVIDLRDERRREFVRKQIKGINALADLLDAAPRVARLERRN